MNRRRNQYGYGRMIDLSYDGKYWNLSRSKKVPEKSDRPVFGDSIGKIIELPMPNVESGDVSQGVYQLRVNGRIMLSQLLYMISDVYREHSSGSISSMVDGQVSVIRLEPISEQVYSLVLA